MSTSWRNMRSFRAASIGSISAWLPSRRSVDSQIGGRVILREGHVRSGRSIGANGRYLCEGARCMANPVSDERSEPSWRTARALLEARGGVLSAREAQQEQQAARKEGREGRRGDEKAAHPRKLSRFSSRAQACLYTARWRLHRHDRGPPCARCTLLRTDLPRRSFPRASALRSSRRFTRSWPHGGWIFRACTWTRSTPITSSSSCSIRTTRRSWAGFFAATTCSAIAYRGSCSSTTGRKRSG